MGHNGDADTILVVHSGADLYGSDRVVLESVTALVARGHRVVALLPGNGALVGQLRTVGAEVFVGPSFVLRKRLLRPKNWIRLGWSCLLGILCAVRILARFRPAVLLVNTVTLPMWPLLGRAMGARVVSHIHEADSEMPVGLRRVLIAPHLASETVVCNSEFTRTVVLEAFPQLRKRIRILYNGVAAPTSKVPAREALNNELRVLYLGRLSPRKGPDLVVRAVKELNVERFAAKLMVAGTAFEGLEWFENELRAGAVDFQGRSVATFAGFVSDVWPLLAEADVLVVPSRLDESFGNTAVEGILAARPVVVSNTSGLREAARGYGSAIYVEPNDLKAIEDALTRIYREWDYFSTQAALDAVAAEAKHSLATYRRKLADIVVSGAVKH